MHSTHPCKRITTPNKYLAQCLRGNFLVRNESKCADLSLLCFAILPDLMFTHNYCWYFVRPYISVQDKLVSHVLVWIVPEIINLKHAHISRGYNSLTGRCILPIAFRLQGVSSLQPLKTYESSSTHYRWVITLRTKQVCIVSIVELMVDTESSILHFGQVILDHLRRIRRNIMSAKTQGL